MKIYVKKVEGVSLPQKGSELSAGYDVVATGEPKIVGEKVDLVWRRIDFIEYDTNLFIAPEALTLHTLIHPRSSISKYNLVLANSVGLVDNDYRGMVICRFKYIWQPEDMWPDAKGHSLVGKINVDKIYKKGDKIAQLVFEPTVQVEFELVDDLQTTQRGAGGFGSTDVPTVQGKFAYASKGNYGRIYPKQEADTIRIERPKSTEEPASASLPPGIPPEQKIEVDTDPKPKYSEENKYVGQNSILDQWLKKGTHSAPPVSYEKLVKEREKGMS